MKLLRTTKVNTVLRRLSELTYDEVEFVLAQTKAHQDEERPLTPHPNDDPVPAAPSIPR